MGNGVFLALCLTAKEGSVADECRRRSRQRSTTRHPTQWTVGQSGPSESRRRGRAAGPSLSLRVLTRRSGGRQKVRTAHDSKRTTQVRTLSDSEGPVANGTSVVAHPAVVRPSPRHEPIGRATGPSLSLRVLTAGGRLPHVEICVAVRVVGAELDELEPIARWYFGVIAPLRPVLGRLDHV